jgi:hypothetical protein
VPLAAAVPLVVVKLALRRPSAWPRAAAALTCRLVQVQALC